jgi:hypothetical protein
VTIERKRTVLAFALAPLTAPLLWWAVFLAYESQNFSEALGELAFVIVGSVPIIYGAALGVGVPLYLVIEKWSRLRFWHPVLIGSVAGGAAYWLWVGRQGGLFSLLSGAVLGAASGTCFWLIWRCPTRRCSACRKCKHEEVEVIGGRGAHRFRGAQR